MSVKGRKSRQWRHPSTDRRHPLKAFLKPRRATSPEPFPSGKVTGTVRARQLLADALAQASVDPWAVEEEVCAGCGLEKCAWLGNQGGGYTRDGKQNCCQGCGDRCECPCWG